MKTERIELMNKKNVLTCTGGGGRLLTAFTMAEILLSLTIIGVVAAITLPSLTGNINERTWNTQRKALYARISQAISLMPALNGYGTLKEESSAGASDAVDTAAETFVTNGLAKVLKINNICDSEHLKDCGIADKITALNGSTFSMPATMGELNSRLTGSYSTAVDNMLLLDTKAAAFETQNGESITVFYNPRCIGSLNETGLGIGGVYIAPKTCANLIYDLNGNKGPNTVGKDIGFITAMYPYDAKVVAPVPAVHDLDGTYKISSGNSEVNATRACTNYDAEYRLPNIDELASMFINRKLIEGPDSTFGSSKEYWSGTRINTNTQWFLGRYGGGGIIDDTAPTTSLSVWCIKR